MQSHRQFEIAFIETTPDVWCQIETLLIKGDAGYDWFKGKIEANKY